MTLEAEFARIQATRDPAKIREALSLLRQVKPRLAHRLVVSGEVPPGFAPIFAGWNVWDVWQAGDLDFDVMMAGLGRDRRLKIWVEDTAQAVPGVDLDRPWNLGHLSGDKVEIIQNPGTLKIAAKKEDLEKIPMLDDKSPELRTVRFWNRGQADVMSWPVSSDYLLDRVYEPAKDNPITAAPEPKDAADVVSDIAEDVKDVAAAGGKILGWAFAIVAGVFVIKAVRG